MASFPTWLRGAALGAAALAAVLLPGAARAEDTIKVGILHSLSGTMAISETTLKDVMLMLIDEQNKKGGLLGKKLEAVVVDPASNWPLFAEKARQLLTVDKVAAVFGCWTSVSRKSVLPVFEELNGILFYPVQYEGQESSRNVFYTGAAPNQQAIPAVDYLMSEDGREALGAGRHRLRLSAHHQQDSGSLPEEQGRRRRRHHDQLHAVRPSPTGRTIVAKIKKFGSAGKKTAVVSTINGDANVPFYKELGNQGIKATDIPVVAFSRRRGGTGRHRHQAADRPSRRLELFRERRHARQQGVHQGVARLHQEAEAHHQRPDGGALHRLQHVGEGGGEGRHHRSPTR